MSANASQSARLGKLMEHLAGDSSNPALLADTAVAAYDEKDLDLATELVARYAAVEPLSPSLRNLEGLVALDRRKFAEAVVIFRGLHDGGLSSPALRFNLAWAYAMSGAYREALDFLDDETVAASERAPSLKIQMMHHLGLFDEALACGQTLTARYPADQTLAGALATLAMDAEKPDLALSYAERAGDNDEGRVALGLLTLENRNAAQSVGLFEQVTGEAPQNPRAWIGKGLSLLMTGKAAEGAQAIDHGADLFRNHIGSWVASGWAHFLNDDYVKARGSFQRALSIDPNFAESHGGMAVLDIAEGKFDEARRNAEIALRLNKHCFGAALAKSLLLEKGGRPQLAQKIRAAALSTPIGPRGQTLAQALAGLGGSMRP
jgi:tetratricopeptide (TPR) repeat protein